MLGETLLSTVDGAEEATEWLFGLEGPALILAILCLIALGVAYYKKDKDKTKLEETYREKTAKLEEGFRTYMKDESDERRKELAEMLETVKNNSAAVEALRGDYNSSNSHLTQKLEECHRELTALETALNRPLDRG